MLVFAWVYKLCTSSMLEFILQYLPLKAYTTFLSAPQFLAHEFGHFSVVYQRHAAQDRSMNTIRIRARMMACNAGRVHVVIPCINKILLVDILEIRQRLNAYSAKLLHALGAIETCQLEPDKRIGPIYNSMTKDTWHT